MDQDMFILRPSLIEGMGVFATREIPKNMTAFPMWSQVHMMRIQDVPEPFRRYCIYVNEHELFAPLTFDILSIDCYINHSKQSNVRIKTDGQLETKRLIKANEEILLDYNELNEPSMLKDAFYRT